MISIDRKFQNILLKRIAKKNQQNFKTEKAIKRKGNKLYVKWKGFNNSFNCWIDKKRHNINELIFSKTKFFRENAKVELDLFNYATKTNLKKATGADTSDFAKKTD